MTPAPPVMDGKTGEVIDTKKKRRASVDGKDAIIDQTQHEAPKPLPPFPKIKVPAGAFEALQEMFDDGVFKGSMNLVTGAKTKPCQAEETVDGIVVKCPHRAVIRAAEIDECATCHRKKKVTKRDLCLPHSAIHWGAKQPVTVQMELGENDNHQHHD